MISLAAAPDGMRVGIVAAMGPGLQTLITVAPKMWRDVRQPYDRVVTGWPSGHTELTLHETDRLHIGSPSDDAERMFAAMLRRTRAGSGTWRGALLAPDIPPVKLGAEDWSQSSGGREQTANLLRLFQRVQLVLAPDEKLTSRTARSPIYRPLSARQFLDEVERRLAQARRGYRRVWETRATIRGQVGARSIARYRATGVPLLDCKYEELTESTVLLGVICTALEDLAEGKGARSVLPAPSFDEATLRRDAVRLRRAMGEVAALPIASALLKGRQLRLNRLDQPWASALRLALLLLSGREVVAAAGQHQDFSSSELSAETDRIWEWIVNAALARTSFDRVLEQGAAQVGLNEDPWKRHPISIASRVTTAPDNIAFDGASVFVIDAKYKTPNSAPSRDDQYQMFAYTHLVRSSGREVRAAVLVYPGTATPTEWIRGRDISGEPVRLYAVQMPFPAPSDLVTQRAWGSYLNRCGDALSASLGLAARCGTKSP
jgi:5-methylcytosine-specific restriction endonuclease McrBC regulatory subunit McrC